MYTVMDLYVWYNNHIHYHSDNMYHKNIFLWLVTLEEFTRRSYCFSAFHHDSDKQLQYIAVRMILYI